MVVRLKCEARNAEITHKGSASAWRATVAFEGNLKDFALGDVFRLIATGGKTGTLYLDRGANQAKVCFRDGRIFFATSTLRHEPLGSRLVQARAISEAQLQNALEVQESEKGTKGGRRIGQILIDEGLLEDIVLERFIREQIVDTLFDLFRWDDGSMRFELDDSASEEDIGLSAPVDLIIEEASRRLEQWDRMGAHIPSLDARFVMAVSPAEKSMEIYLKPREWMLLCHMHGGQGIRSLAEATGFTHFETARILYGMLSAGLVETCEGPEVASLPTFDVVADTVDALDGVYDEESSAKVS